MTKRITTENASIRTTSVDVRVISISGKQMTLSVFRQLKEEDLIDPKTLTLRGTTWGTVNYFWGDDVKRGDTHLHVVWQNGDELRRDLVPQDLYRYTFWRTRRETLDIYFKAMVILGAAEGTIGSERQKDYEATIEGRNLHCGMSGYRTPYDIDEAFGNVFRYRSREDGFARDLVKRSIVRLVDYANTERPVGTTFDEAHKLAVEAARELNDAEARWAKLRTSLEQLEQLFIAV